MLPLRTLDLQLQEPLEVGMVEQAGQAVVRGCVQGGAIARQQRVEVGFLPQEPPDSDRELPGVKRPRQQVVRAE